MSLSYEPLWQMLNNINISKMEFAKKIGMSNATLAKLSKNEPITLTTVDKICNQFNCPIENVVKHIPEAYASDSIFTIGTIILMNDLSDSASDNFRLRKRPYVILKVITPKNTNAESTLYKVAPIFSSTIINKKDSQNFCFENIEIDGKTISGYISLKNIKEISSGKFEKKVGVIPFEYLEKILMQNSL